MVLQLPNQLNQQASVNTLRIKSLILGSSGYVGSELIRLIEMHPDYELTSVVSESHSCKKVSDVFPHLFLTKKNQILWSKSYVSMSGSKGKTAREQSLETH